MMYDMRTLTSTPEEAGSFAATPWALEPPVVSTTLSFWSRGMIVDLKVLFVFEKS